MTVLCKKQNGAAANGSAQANQASKRALVCRVGALALLGVSLAASGCAKKAQPQHEQPPRAVTVSTAVSQDVPLYLDTLGRTTAFESVSIVPQVSGTLETIGFTQGTDVKKGDLLFTIDPALYRAAVMQAEGAVAQAKAQLEIDQKQLERSRSLLPDKLISEQEFQALEAKVEGDKGALELAQGQLESAKVNLGYAEIRSPIDGTIGFYEVNAGNVVSAAAGTVLTTIQRMDPIYVDFIVPESQFSELRRHYRQQGNQLPITVSFLYKDGFTKRDARLKILGNAISRNTGTIRLRAEMENKDHAFWPEQPVSVRVILDTVKNAVVVPIEAVGIGSQGRYVFIIKEEGGKTTATQVPVSVGQLQDDGKSIVVTEGLEAGQRVVLEGQVFLISGQQVEIKPAAGSASAASSAAATPAAAAGKPAAAKAADTAAKSQSAAKPAEGGQAAK